MSVLPSHGIRFRPNTGWPRIGVRLLSFILGLLLWGNGAAAELAPALPAITSIRAVGQELVVTVAVPPGKHRVTLESRPRLIRGAWTPRDVKWSEANHSGELTFTLSLERGMEMLRVRAETDSEIGLPASFFQGLKVFAPTVQAGSNGRESFPGGPATVSTDDASGVLNLNLNQSPETPRTVVESDIWKLDGHTLYFFNQQRGLQVIDLSDPDRPIVSGLLPLAVWGEQMYRLPATTADGSVWLALLAQQGCDGNGSEILLVNVKSGRPTLAHRLPVRGQLRETRLVGDALYVASYDWSQNLLVSDPENSSGVTFASWESRTLISAFDLADPASPVAQPVVELPVNPDAIAATDRYLFVATTGSRIPQPNERLPEWAVAGNHGILLYDLSDPRGTVTQSGFFRTSGRVADKFKIGTIGPEGSALAVISQVDGQSRLEEPDGSNGPITIWKWIPPQTVVETFSFNDLASSAPLAQLTLVTNESLFGTRFSGDRVYAVTFRVVDPLWIVDLSDPLHPAVKGEVQIPGYSTYLQPLADNTRLLALGMDGGRTTVQLFDVANPAQASLLSKVFLGEGWSWSEGNSDEKAFQVFPDAGLALVPWQGRQEGKQPGQWFQGVQLIDIDLTGGKLRARGVIDHALQARRATLLGDRIVSLSAQELLTVDATDRDHPRTVAELALSTQVDRVFVQGDQLIEIRNSGALPAQVALASVAQPEIPLAVLALDPLPILGADLRGNRLVLIQSRADEWRSEERTLSNAVIKSVPQPPIKESRTEFVVAEVPPPMVEILVTNIFIFEEEQEATTNIVVQLREVPQPIATNIVSTTTLKTRPPSPLDPLPSSYHLTWIRPEFTPQPSSLQTNAVVVWVNVPQPPLLVTNWITETTWEGVRIPGEFRLSILEVGAGTLQPVAQVSWENPADFYGSSLTALWPSEDTVVWTESSSQSGWYDGWYGPLAIDSPITMMPTGGISFQGDQMMIPGVNWRFWWGPWWGQETRNFLAFDLAEPSVPQFASHTRLGGTNEWNSFSSAFVSDGKVFVSHRVSKLLSVPEPPDPVTGNGGIILLPPAGQINTWEHHSYLDVIDYADVADPVVRAPVEVPGTLQGVSHNASLAYVSGGDPTISTSGSTARFLHALAYDGLQASLVASMSLPELSPQPLLVLADGRVFLGRAATNSPSALETWAINVAGQFDRYATVPLTVPAEELHAFDDLLIVTTGETYRFYSLTEELLAPLGDAERPCGLWFDWNSADASPDSGLWIPRGVQGLWQAQPSP